MSKLRIVIDPGHYTNYNKGVYPGYYEGNAVYQLALHLKEELEKDTDQVEVIILEDTLPDVIMTKASLADNPELYARGQVAVKNNATVFLSLHSNAVGDTSKYELAYGVSVYRSLFLPNSEDLGHKLADAVVAVMRPVTGFTYSRGVLTRKSDVANRDYYGVIRGAVSSATSTAQASKGPVKHAFIIEHGFHTNSKECAFLADDNNLRKIAKAEADVIKEHFGITGSTEPHPGINSDADAQTPSATPQDPQTGTNNVIGTVKVIYEGADGLNVHTTPEWGSHNLNLKNGPVHAGEIFRVTEKMDVGGSPMYKLYSGAGYITASEKYVTFTPEVQGKTQVTAKEIKVGDKVRVLKNLTYTGGSFKLYYDKYDVISISGDRVVIGIGKTVTCAIHKDNIALV